MKINYKQAKIILNVRRGHEAKEKLPNKDNVNYLTNDYVDNILPLRGSTCIFDEWVDSYISWLEFQQINPTAVHLQMPRFWEDRIKRKAKLLIKDRPHYNI